MMLIGRSVQGAFALGHTIAEVPLRLSACTLEHGIPRLTELNR